MEPTERTVLPLDASEKRIPPRAYYGNHNLVQVEIRDGVKEIGDDAFVNCSKLERVIIPDSVEVVGKNPFDACQNLVRIEVSPDHPFLAVIDGILYSKADRRLVCCPPKQSYRENSQYSIPKGIRIIGAHAFESNVFTRVKIPDSVEIIEEYAFFCCHLTGVDIPESVRTIGIGAFEFCSKMASLRLPTGIREIGRLAFSQCKKLKNISIPESVTVLGYDAFDEKSLDEASVKKQREANKRILAGK